MTLYLATVMSYLNLIISSNFPPLCSADLPMSFEDRVAAVGVATEFQENSGQVFKMIEEETDTAKTQVCLGGS